MTEKIIHEVKFIETDDGFRIEINGDKEQLKKMGFGPGMFGLGMMGMDALSSMGRRFRFMRHRQHGHGPGKHGRHFRRKFMHGPAPWMVWDEWDDDFEEDELSENPPKGV